MSIFGLDSIRYGTSSTSLKNDKEYEQHEEEQEVLEEALRMQRQTQQQRNEMTQVIVTADGKNKVQVKTTVSQDLAQEREREKEKQKKVNIQRKPIQSDNSTVQLRDFPRSLTLMARQMFPDAQSNTKAVAALMYANRDMNSTFDYDDVPEDVIELAARCDTFRNQENIVRNLQKLDSIVHSLVNGEEVLLYAISYLIYDRLGFRQDSPVNPADTNFNVKGMNYLQDNLMQATARYKKEREYNEGRPL